MGGHRRPRPLEGAPRRGCSVSSPSSSASRRRTSCRSTRARGSRRSSPRSSRSTCQQPDRLAILQDPQDYPGVHVMPLTVRTYPQGDLAAQVLGYVGEVTADKLAEKKKRLPARRRDRARRRRSRVRVRAPREAADARRSRSTRPVNKSAVRSTSTRDRPATTCTSRSTRRCNASPQQSLAAGHLRRAQSAERERGEGLATRPLKAPAGAAVVLDADDGSVVALASYPTYPPNWWVGGISTAHYDAFLSNPASDYPLARSRDAGPVRAGLHVQARDVARDDARTASAASATTTTTRARFVSTGPTFHNAGNGEVFGPVNLEQALTVSSDTYFYTVGDDFWHVVEERRQDPRLGIQTEARELGFGAATGFELDEAAGRVPDPAWKAAFAHANYKTEAGQATTTAPGTRTTTSSRRSARATSWSRRSNSRTRTRRSPTTERSGTRTSRRRWWTPKGTADQRRARRRSATSTFDPTTRAADARRLRGRGRRSPKGTAYDAFQGFPLDQIPIAGKTGTAQVQGKGDTSLFVAMFPANGKPRTSWSVVVEQAGFGAQTAAPIARRIIETMNGLPDAAGQVDPAGPRLMAAASSRAGRAETSPWRHADPLLLALPFAISGARPADDLLVVEDAARDVRA